MKDLKMDKMMRQISAKIIAGSKNEHGQKITTWVLTYPRFIHAEMMTHRVFSRNAASSRAIPALKMIADVESDPFIPVAFQKEHKGMQGTEYIDDETIIDMREASWLSAKDAVISVAKTMSLPIYDIDGDVPEGEDREPVTKQLTNRLLEPFQWYTAIFTTTETENFFELRCPQYSLGYGTVYRSRKDAMAHCKKTNFDNISELDWLLCNRGQGEIHISLLAEAMYDSMNEYQYKQLKAGEWHCPMMEIEDDL